MSVYSAANADQQVEAMCIAARRVIDQLRLPLWVSTRRSTLVLTAGGDASAAIRTSGAGGFLVVTLDDASVHCASFDEALAVCAGICISRAVKVEADDPSPGLAA